MRIKSILLLSLLAASLACMATYAEETPTEVQQTSFNNALGMYGTTFGSYSGMGGLQYQHWADRLGFQITAGGAYSSGNSSGRPLEYSVLLDGLWSVYGNEFTRFFSGKLYLWATVGHHGFIPSEYEVQYSKTFQANFIAGGGIGIEAILFKHLSFPLQFGYTAEFPNQTVVKFSFGAGLRYRF